MAVKKVVVTEQNETRTDAVPFNLPPLKRPIGPAVATTCKASRYGEDRNGKIIRHTSATIAPERVAASEQVKRQLAESSNQDRRRSRVLKPPAVIDIDNEADKWKKITYQRMEEELLRACKSEGLSKAETAGIMGVTENYVAVVEKRLFAYDGQREIVKSSAQRFYEYSLMQEQCVRDLDYFVQRLYESIRVDTNDEEKKGKSLASNIQAAIMAIKAKSEIHRQTISMGQELGIIQKRAKEIRVSGSLNLAALPTERLRVELQDRLNQFSKLVQEGSLPPVYREMLKARVEPQIIDAVPESIDE